MSRLNSLAMLLMALSTLPAQAGATEVRPVDLGLLRNTELSVVQKRLYPMNKRTEMSASLGIQPFDAFTFAPVANLGFGYHFSEELGMEISAGGGFGFKTGTYKELEGPAYGIAPEAYKYVGRAMASVEWTPIYGKFNWRGKSVVHDNVYGLLGAGATVEQCVLPTAAWAISPGIGVGLGMRFFVKERMALRFEVRDDLFIEHRDQTDTSAFKQNVYLLAGVSRLGKVK